MLIHGWFQALILWVSFQISVRVHHQWLLLSCDCFTVRMEYLCSGPCKAIDRFADYKPQAVERTPRPFGWGALVEYTHSYGNEQHCALPFVPPLFPVMKLQNALFESGLWMHWRWRGPIMQWGPFDIRDCVKVSPVRLEIPTNNLHRACPSLRERERERCCTAKISRQVKSDWHLHPPRPLLLTTMRVYNELCSWVKNWPNPWELFYFPGMASAVLLKLICTGTHF